MLPKDVCILIVFVVLELRLTVTVRLVTCLVLFLGFVMA